MSHDSPPPPPPPPPPSGFGGSYPPPPGGYPPPPGGFGYGPKYNQKVIVALVTGILGLMCCGPLGIVAIILGVMGGKEIAASAGAQKGSGMGIASIILGVLALALMVLSYWLGSHDSYLPR